MAAIGEQDNAVRFVAFLGGINVGGHRVRKDELRALFEALGFTEVSTFLASGNVIFDVVDGADDIEARIGKELAAQLGYEVPTFVRTAEEVRVIAGRAPFASELLEASSGKLQVTMLRVAPDTQAREGVLARATDDDRLAIVGRELFWLPSGGISDSVLDLVAIYRLLGPGTMRTRNTIGRIVARFLTASAS
jgi:uncharacterized protein (DUF1697 family)